MASINSNDVQNRPNERIRRDLVQKAVISLLKWKEHQISSKQTPNSSGDDEFIYLLLTLRKIPPKQLTRNPIKLALTHSLHKSLESESESEPELSSCLIIDDRPKPNSQKLTFEFAEKKIKSENIPISKILKFSKLKSDYQSFEAKSKLFNSFDVFLADRRIIDMLPKILGKVFYKKKKKIPVPVELNRKGNWKEEIEMGLSCCLLWLSNGTCSVVRIGKFGGMEVEEIVDNVVAAVAGVVEVVPKKWVGVKSFHLKFFDSLALPIYQRDRTTTTSEEDGNSRNRIK